MARISWLYQMLNIGAWIEVVHRYKMTNVSDIITETGRTKRGDLFVRNIKWRVKGRIFLKRMIACGIEIEHFETYKPSLNDIFVSLVGDDIEDDKVVDYKNNSNDDNSYNRDNVDELPQGESSEHKKGC